MDDPSRLALLKILFPKVPAIATATARHTLGLSQASSKWDLKTALIMATIRSFLMNPKPSAIGKVQKLSTKDPGIRGPMWISKQTIPASADSAAGVLEAILSAVSSLAGPGHQQPSYNPDICPVEVEWTGARSGVDKSAARLDMHENSHYERLMSEVTSDVTILYFHGGAMYLMDPATHRVSVARLAKHTGGRAMSVRYRLAPQNPFPSALLDCLIAYLALLSPPPGSIHAPVPHDKIVLAGDSAGGNLCLALLQLILQLHRQNSGCAPALNFHGQEVQVLLPGGLALQSPWVDLTRSMPSIVLNTMYDYLPPPREGMGHKTDAIWPAKPPRVDLYCESSMICHPLVSPIAADDWHGAPPIFICIGQECLADEDMVIARRLASSNVKTEFWQYEAMPHVFPAIFTDLQGAKEAMEKWADAISRMSAGKHVETKGTWVEAKSLIEKPLDVRCLAAHLADEDVRRRMKNAQVKGAKASVHEQPIHLSKM